MGWHTLFCCSVLLLFLSTASSFPTIDKIRDLRGVWYGNIFPRHGLHLLYWFVDQSEIDNNHDIIQNHFDPARGDYGFGYFDNNYSFLPALTDPKRQAYYVVGDISKANSWALPEYVTENYYNSLKSGDRNMDRIIVRVVQQEGSDQSRLDKVFVTQLYPLNDNQANSFHPNQTYTISFNLLREIKMLQVGQFRNDTLAGLEAFLRQAGYQTCPSPEFQVCYVKSIRFQRLQMVEMKTEDDCHLLRLEVKPAENGYLKMSWSNLPKSIMDSYMVVGLFKDDASLTKIAESPVGGETHGTSDVFVDLNPGLQVRLLKSLWDTTEREVWRGAEFDDANSLIPVIVKGYDASLQLYTKNGYACARLFVKASFADWKEVFYYSWVGYYSANSVSINEYQTYQWAVYFTKETSLEEIPEYDVYVYESSMAIAPGAQARFMLSNYNELTRTVAWESQH